MLLRHTMRSRLTAKVHEITLELRRRLHEPIVSRGAVLRGHCLYYGVPTNIPALDVFGQEVTHRWLKLLRQLSQRRRLNCERMNRLAQQWLPRASIVHPWPAQRFAVRT
jgi:RNA-directed DNA polymerase